MQDELHSTSEGPFLTVFTPTYNRGYTLHLVYESLKKQTFKDFEWLIVDDGSTDSTRNIVEEWINDGEIPIRYIFQKNGGKHRATNVGILNARGDMFLIFDSDDSCMPCALQVFYESWQNIPDLHKKEFSTLSALCESDNGKVLGELYPQDVFDVEDSYVQYIMRASGDRWGINKTSILRQFMYPEFEGERFIPESVVWNRMSLCYKARFINKVIKTVTYRPDGLTKRALEIRVNNPKGVQLCYKEMLSIKGGIFFKMKNIFNYYRFSFHCKSCSIEKNFLGLILFAPAFLCYMLDVLRLKLQNE